MAGRADLALCMLGEPGGKQRREAHRRGVNKHRLVLTHLPTENNKQDRTHLKIKNYQEKDIRSKVKGI